MATITNLPPTTCATCGRARALLVTVHAGDGTLVGTFCKQCGLIAYKRQQAREDAPPQSPA